MYEVGAEHGRHYFLMALVEGSSLAARRAEGPLDEHDAARLVQSAVPGGDFGVEQVFDGVAVSPACGPTRAGRQPYHSTGVKGGKI